MRDFGNVRHTRDASGQITASKLSPARAKTIDGLPGNYGPDRGRRLVVSLDAGDLVTVRPAGTQRGLSIRAVDLYGYLIRTAATVAHLAKARAAKERKAVRLAQRRQEAAEKRLLR